MSLLFSNDRAGHHAPSWYAAHTEIPAANAPLRGGHRADVAVIGAGYTGLSAALELARWGAKVIVVDSHRIGFGASGRNGGQIGPGYNWPQALLAKHLGHDTARGLWDMSVSAVDWVRDFAKNQPGIDFRPGLALAGLSAKSAAKFHSEAAYLRKNYGYDPIDLDRDAMADIIASPLYHGGVLDRNSGHVNPLGLAVALGKSAQTAGAEIYENSHVTSVAPGKVTLADGHIEAPKILLASNGYLSGLRRGLAAPVARRVMPINNFIVATERLDPGAVLTQDIAVADDKFVVNYFRMSNDNRLIFGGGETYGHRFPDDIAAKVRRPLGQIFPQLRDVRIDYAWGGTLAITTSRLPHLGEIAPGVFSASGYSGHGIALANLAGRIMATHFTAPDQSAFSLFSGLPTPGFPGGAWSQKPLLALAMGWFSLRDRLGI